MQIQISYTFVMDSKQIVNRIWDTQLRLPDGDLKPILIIDLKSSVSSLRYEIYSTLGEYLSGLHSRQIDFSQVSNNRNHLIFYLDKLDVERVFFIRLFDVEVINTQLPNQHNYMNSRQNIASEPVTQLVKITDPIFYFHQLKPIIQILQPSEPEQANIIFAVDDERQTPIPDILSSIDPSLNPLNTTSPQIANQSKDNHDICHICQNNFEEGDDTKELPCKHRFHSKEINEWFEKKQTCPICDL